MLAQVLIAEADSFVAMWKDLKLRMAATVSCALAMGRIGQSKPGWDPSRCVAPRCAARATRAPRRKSASPRLSWRSGRGGRRSRRMHAGPDRRTTRGQEGARRFPDRSARERPELA